MTDRFKKNNLNNSASPYLRQHADNPVYWQEWSEDVLDFAKKNNKKIFLSIGYSTCHWCHVMAGEAFSDEETASYLNEHFVSVKVDREQRPDIDNYFMSFMTATTGRGGWPLNVFLTPDAEPIVSFTYLPVKSKRGLPSFKDFLVAVYENGESADYDFSVHQSMQDADDLQTVINSLIRAYDYPHGGFGKGPKFPPSCALLLLLSYYERYRSDEAKDIVESTLDVMMSRGLYDHLQGGFFRYCVDREWTIPHFEKMLYDQAMLLWVYSWGYAAFKHERYLNTINDLIECLNTSFSENGLYISAHDADTEHIEGDTYLWDMEELKEKLSADEFVYMTETYFISDVGNFEGKNHLIRIQSGKRGLVEKKLLEIRGERTQPFRDRKIITSWNALTGIAILMAWRATGDQSLLLKAESIMDKIVSLHLTENGVAHSSLEGIVQKEGFLEDAASLLLFATYLHEEKRDRSELMKKIAGIADAYYDRKWCENIGTDFRRVPASSFDHPVPSSLSIITMAMLRLSLLTGKTQGFSEERHIYGSEFKSLALFIAEGQWHIVHSPVLIEWSRQSINTIQVPGEGFSDCFDGACRVS